MAWNCQAQPMDMVTICGAPNGPSALQCRDSLRGAPSISSMSCLRKLTPLQKICFIRAMRIDCLKAMWIPFLGWLWLVSGLECLDPKPSTSDTPNISIHILWYEKCPCPGKGSAWIREFPAFSQRFELPKISTDSWKVSDLGLHRLAKKEAGSLHHDKRNAFHSSRLLWSHSSPSRSVISLWSHPLSTSASLLPIRLLGMENVWIAPWCFLKCFFFLRQKWLFTSSCSPCFPTFQTSPSFMISFHIILSGPLYIYDPRSSSYLPLLVQHVSHVFFPSAILRYASFINQSFEAALGSHLIPDAPCV